MEPESLPRIQQIPLTELFRLKRMSYKPSPCILVAGNIKEIAKINMRRKMKKAVKPTGSNNHTVLLHIDLQPKKVKTRGWDINTGWMMEIYQRYKYI